MAVPRITQQFVENIRGDIAVVTPNVRGTQQHVENVRSDIAVVTPRAVVTQQYLETIRSIDIAVPQLQVTQQFIEIIVSDIAVITPISVDIAETATLTDTLWASAALDAGIAETATLADAYGAEGGRGIAVVVPGAEGDGFIDVDRPGSEGACAIAVARPGADGPAGIVVNVPGAAPSSNGALLAANNLSDVEDVAASRLNLGLGALALEPVPLVIAKGGTGANSAATARTALGVTASGVDTAYAFRANNLSDLVSVATARANLGVTATGADTTYLVKTANLSDVANVTTARTNLGITATGADTTYAFRANNLSDVASAASARTNLGLKTAAVEDTGTTGHTIPFLDGINSWAGNQGFGTITVATPIPITSGGTGANTAATARTALGITATGADTAYVFRASNLSDLASITTARTNLGVTATGADTAYAFRANNLSDLANATTARTSLGLGTAAVMNTGMVANTVPFIDGGGSVSINSPLSGPGNAEKLSVWEGSAAGFTAFFWNHHAAPTTATILRTDWANAAPNNTSATFLQGNDSGGVRYYIKSNGGLGNYSANNVNISDAGIKTQISPYSERELDALQHAFTSVLWCRFKYRDQTHEDWNHGYTAPDIGAAFENVAPELVDETDLGPDLKEGEAKHKAVYDNDLTHIGLALLARALTKIADLERRIFEGGL